MTTHLQDTPAAPGSLWRHRDFLRYWASQLASRMGVQVAELVLPLAAILLVDATPVELGVVNALAFAPYLLLSLAAGVWIDRSRKRGLLVLSEFGRVVVLAVIPVIALFGAVSLWHLYVVAFLLGVCAVLFDVSGTAYLPSLVERDQLLDGNAKLQATIVVTSSGGPAVAGLLVQYLVPPVVLLMSAVSSLFSLVCLRGIKRREDPPEPKERHALREIGESLRFIAHDRYLRFLTIRSGVNNLFFLARNTMLPLFVLQTLGLGTSALGLVLGVGAIGALIGSMLSKRLASRLGPGRVIAVGYGVASVVQLLLPLAMGPTWLALTIMMSMFFVGGMFMTIGNTNVATLQQMLIPRDQLGRVVAAMRTVTWGSMPVGALVGGVLGSLIGIRETLIVTAVGFCLSALWLVFSPIAKLTAMPEAK
ncbi:MFS transporter [Actinophytocola sediminis]